MPDSSSALWSIIKARDSSLQATRDTYDNWISNLQQELAETKRFLASVEADQTARLASLKSQQSQLAQQGLDLHNAEAKTRALEESLSGTRAYLDTVEQDRQARLDALIESHARIAKLHEEHDSLRRQLAEASARFQQLDRCSRSQPMETQQAFADYGRDMRRALVAQYHERLLPQILQLTALGVVVEVFGCPALLQRDYQGPLRMLTSSLWDWLGAIDSLFNDKLYMQSNPDVAAAWAGDHLRSGREHQMLFGQYEQRPLGSLYSGGIAEFDCILFDHTDAATVLPCIAGRVQTYQRIFVSGCPVDQSWLPPGGAPRNLGDGLLLLHRPPPDWLGSVVPVSLRPVGSDWPRLRPRDIYPTHTRSGTSWPKITVVTVSYNQAGFIEETLRSVLDQQYPNLEYLVVDGGSTDGSVELIRKYAPQLAWWISEKDGGQSEALNKGFRKATGEIFTWLNSDDRLAPGSLFTVADTYLRTKGDVIVGRCARYWNSDPQPHHIHRCSLPLGQRVPLPLDQLLNLDDCWLKGHFFHQPEVFFTKQIFDRAGGSLREDLYYSMDYDLWVRLAKAGAMVVAIPEILAMFRMHAQQKTGGDNLPYLPELREVNLAHRSALQLAG